MEGWSAYVYADEITALSLNTGSRVYITRFTLDYDNQPAYANGSKDNPLKLTEVTHRDLTKMSITTENESNKLMNDSLDLFYSPYVHMSTLGPYLNLAGNIRKEGAPVFEMVQIPSDSKDTLKYELKMGYRVAPNEKESDSYLSSVLLPDIEKGKEQVVTVKFRAKRKGGTNGKFMNDSVWVATYKK